MKTHPCRRRLTSLIVIAIVALAAAVAWGAKTWRPSPVEGTAQSPAGLADAPASPGQDTGGHLTIYPADARAQAPDVEGTTLDGEPLRLADLSGHLVVVNAWGSWCVPCRDEAPVLARVARETAPQGVRFVGIDTRDSSGAANAFERAFEIPYPSIVDPDGQVLLTLKGLIPVSGVPSTLLVDPRGGVAARIIGPTDYQTLHGLIANELTPYTSPRSSPASSPRSR